MQNKSISYPTEIKTLPNARDIETAVLGACLIEKSAFETIHILLESKDFYNTQNQLIFSVMLGLHKDRKPIDMLTVTEELQRTGKLEEAGNVTYIADIADKVASSAHIEYHAKIVKETSIKRQLIEVMQKTINNVYLGDDIGDILFNTGKDIERLQEELIGKNTSTHISNALSIAISDTHTRIERAKQNIQSGINTGLKDLNKKINGWQPSELIILAARPAMGKTAMLLHFAKSAALEGVSSAIFSLEMSNISLANRLILSECNVSANSFKSGHINDGKLQEIEASAGRIWNYPIYIDDNANVSMSYIHSQCRVLHKQGKCDIAFIDYLQLTGESNQKNSTREREIAQMSREAKIIAKELNIPVILLSQLNRSVESRADKKPLLSDLRESGAIEQDADMVLFIHRPEYYDIEPKDNNGMVIPNYGELIIAKNRNGEVGTVKFQHDGTLNKIFDFGGEKLPF